MRLRVIGQDVNVDAIAMAMPNPSSVDVPRPPRFTVADFEHLPFASNSFDAVVFLDALHHALDMRAAIRQVFRVVKKNGIMVASEPGVGHAAGSKDFVAEWASPTTMPRPRF